ncbi:MAG: hypothetical protein HQK74_08620 [Desulfamplus sp.]|nr:hypothetical protein [Desulfamplus sp.]
MKRAAILITAILSLCFTNICVAQLSILTEEMLADSQENIGSRIYAYDFDLSKDGTIHAVYTEPIPGTTQAKIIYATKSVSTKQSINNWAATENRVVLDEFGAALSISTYLMVDDNDVVHICYIVDGVEFIEPELPNYKGHTSGLVYQRVVNGVVQPKINIASGTFHTRMQLNQENKPIFLREYEIFADEEGNQLQPPFKKALKMFIPSDEKDDVWTGKVVDLKSSAHYRLANFVFDKSTGQYHILYGNGDSDKLRAAYPTANPPETKGVIFPAGSAHQLWYAFSSDLKNWKLSQVDQADPGNLSENEFWTELIINNDGVPYASYYKYATDSNGVHQGTSNFIGTYSKTTNSWTMKKVAGDVAPPFLHRAGMGMGIVVDDLNGLHGVWDNSPDKPIDAEGGGGNIMYHYNPDGINWNIKQAIIPYSCEGYARVKIYENTFILMALADARDRRLIFAEFEMPDNETNLIEVTTNKMFYGKNEKIEFHARVQSSDLSDLSAMQELSDIYVVFAGPYDKDKNGNFIPTLTTQYAYLSSDFSWKNVANIADLKPLLSSSPLFDFTGYFLTATAGVDKPFNNPSRYLLVSFANQAGEDFAVNLTTPLFLYEFHICSKSGCSEL